MNLVDSSGWIEYFFAEPNASFFSGPIEDTQELIVPTICLYEVFKKVSLVADKAKAIRAVAHMRQGEVVPLSEDVALKAALLSIQHGLPMADSLIYAIAQTRKAIVWTQDRHFCNLPGVKYRDAQPKTPRRGSGKPRR